VLALSWRPILALLESSLGIVPLTPSPWLAGTEIVAGLAFMAAAGLAMGYFATPLPPASDHA
jgi:hypothetical protein